MITLEICNVFTDHEKHSISYLYPMKKDLISSTQSFQLKVSSKASKIILDPMLLIIRKMHIKITVKQGTKASALGQPRGIEGGSEWGNTCISSVQLLSRVRLFATSWIAARQASLSITNSRSSLRLMCIESVMPSNHLILCRPLLLLPPIPPSIRVFSNESTLRMRWPKY